MENMHIYTHNISEYFSYKKTSTTIITITIVLTFLYLFHLVSFLWVYMYYSKQIQQLVNGHEQIEDIMCRFVSRESPPHSQYQYNIPEIKQMNY